jgi:hypothetical protein
VCVVFVRDKHLTMRLKDAENALLGFAKTSREALSAYTKLEGADHAARCQLLATMSVHPLAFCENAQLESGVTGNATAQDSDVIYVRSVEKLGRPESPLPITFTLARVDDGIVVSGCGFPRIEEHPTVNPQGVLVQARFTSQSAASESCRKAQSLWADLAVAERLRDDAEVSLRS